LLKSLRKGAQLSPGQQLLPSCAIIIITSVRQYSTHKHRSFFSKGQQGATATAASLNFEVLVDEIISPNYSSAVGQTALMKGDSKVGVPNLIA